MTAETDIAAIDDGGENTAAEVRTALTSVLDAAQRPLDTPPGTPHSKDDEFDGTSLNVKWTNPANSATNLDPTVTVGDGVCRINPKTISTRGLYGIRQAAPTGDFEVSAKIMLDQGTSSSDARCGIWWGDDGTSTAGVLGIQDSARRIANYIGVTSFSNTAAWGAYDGTDAIFGNGMYQWGSWVWVRMAWASPTLTVYRSLDGATWKQMTTDSISQPDHIGLGMYCNSAGFQATTSFIAAWFRVTE